MKMYRGTVKPTRSLLSSVDTLGSGFTVSRGHTPTTAMVSLPNRNGVFVEYPQNVARYSRGALVTEEFRTNLVVNPRGESPLGWTSAGSVVGRGVENGLDYVDIQFTSASAATGFAMSFASALASSPGDINTLSFYARMVGGSLSNVTNMQINTLYRDAGAATLLNAVQDISATLASATSIGATRHQLTTTAPALTADKSARFRLNTSGAYDFTIRFAGIQFEVGTGASSLILPAKGAPVSTTRSFEGITRSIAPTKYASRNLYVRSEDFASGGWTRGNLTFNSAAATGPYSGTLADAAVPAATTSTHTVSQSIPASSFTIGNRYAISVYAKGGSLNYVRFSLSTVHLAGGANGIYFDLTTGAVTLVGSILAAANLVTTATPIGSGWWRLTATYTVLTNSAATITPSLQFTATNASNSFTGDGVTVAGWFWGAQWTQSDVVPAYVQTVASQAASHSKGTIVCVASMPTIPPSGYFPAFVAVYDDASGNNLNWFYNSGINTLEMDGITRGVSNLSSQFTFSSIPTAGVPFRLALAWDTTTGIVSCQAHNGSSMSPVYTAFADLLPIFNFLGIGYNPPVLSQQGLTQFQRVSLYETAVPAANLYQLIAA